MSRPSCQRSFSCLAIDIAFSNASMALIKSPRLSMTLPKLLKALASPRRLLRVSVLFDPMRPQPSDRFLQVRII